METRRQLYADYRKKIQRMSSPSEEEETPVNAISKPEEAVLPSCKEDIDPNKRRRQIWLWVKIGLLVVVLIAFFLWYHFGLRGAR